jgi:peptide-methionine (S)-S-oxide reductase
MLCDLRGISLNLPPDRFPDPVRDLAPAPGSGPQLAVLAGGCFWCVEAVFKEVDGVLEVSSGYAGDDAASANYEAVCNGNTNHAEAVRLRYDPARVSYGQLLKLFFSVAHDPTQLNRQGNDRGRQYRSAIFYADEAQRTVADAYIRQLEQAGAFKARIVTSLEPLAAFYEAETYHRDYAARNPDQPYIAMVAMPKVEKLRAYFGDKLKR